jgi:hypothetical protein
MAYVGWAVIGFLIGLVVCYWAQLKKLYENRQAISDVSDIQAGVSAVQDLYHRI